MLHFNDKSRVISNLDTEREVKQPLALNQALRPVTSPTKLVNALHVFFISLSFCRFFTTRNLEISPIFVVVSRGLIPIEFNFHRAQVAHSKNKVQLVELKSSIIFQCRFLSPVLAGNRTYQAEGGLFLVLHLLAHLESAMGGFRPCQCQCHP